MACRFYLFRFSCACGFFFYHRVASADALVQRVVVAEKRQKPQNGVPALRLWNRRVMHFACVLGCSFLCPVVSCVFVRGSTAQQLCPASFWKARRWFSQTPVWSELEGLLKCWTSGTVSSRCSVRHEAKRYMSKQTSTRGGPEEGRPGIGMSFSLFFSARYGTALAGLPWRVRRRCVDFVLFVNLFVCVIVCGALVVTLREARVQQ